MRYYQFLIFANLVMKMLSPIILIYFTSEFENVLTVNHFCFYSVYHILHILPTFYWTEFYWFTEFSYIISINLSSILEKLWSLILLLLCLSCGNLIFMQVGIHQYFGTQVFHFIVLF